MADIFENLKQRRGAPTDFKDITKGGDYSVSSATYPSDLLADGPSNQYGGNYVIFYINVREDSMLSKNEADIVAPSNVPARMNGDARGMDVSGDAKVVLGAATGVAAGSVVKEITGSSPSSVGVAILDKAIGAAAGAAAVVVAGSATKQYKRLRQAIAMHVPTDLSIKYGVNWEETDMAGGQMLAAGAEGAVGALEEGKASSAVGAVRDYLVGKALKTPGVGDFISKTSGTTANPKKEQLFRNVDFRTFTFSYQFFSRSAEEAKQIQQIIKLFKLHMHPEYKEGNNFLYTYPSEFDIFYYNNGKENMNIHRHTSCVLTDMNISYSPQTIFSTFKDGMPSQINIQLTFKELALLSKESIQDGY